MSITLHISSSPEQVATDFAVHFSQQLPNKDFHIALSGGSTPRLLFKHLAEDYPEINWQAIHLYWGDERCVPPEDEESNFKMTNDLLLQHIDIPSTNVHRVKGELSPQDASEQYEHEILAHVPLHNGLPQFDMVILGMGDDGHTASIFPHQLHLISEDGVTAVAQHPTSGQHRVTLTGPVINNASEVDFLVTGEAKRAKFTEILHKTGDWESYPASYVQAKNLHWFTDLEIAE